MINQFSTEISFTSKNSNGSLPGFPKSDVKSIVFDGEDATVFVYVEQFRSFLRACGFHENSINDAMGEE
jgi:hypothetical protein